MQFLPGSVEGQYFVDTDTAAKTRTRSETETDAFKLLAAFAFGGEGRPRIILTLLDELLELLRDPRFRADQITLKGSDDIPIQANQRRRKHHYGVRRIMKVIADFIKNRKPVGVEAQMHIRSRTETDVLLNAFMLDRLSPGAIDALLALLRDPRFITDQVTLASSEDFLLYITDSHRRLARSLSIPTTSESNAPAANIPEELLDLIMIVIADDAQWGAPTRTQHVTHVEHVRFLPSKDLKSASLVHRTWTAPAQRALRSSVEVTGSTGLYTAFRSLLVCPWTRQMAVTEWGEEDRCGDAFFLFRSLPQYFPNIVVLSLYGGHEPGEYFRHADEAILSLGGLKYLECLTIHDCHSPSILWEAIARMPSLKSLKLMTTGACSYEEAQVPASLQNRAPSTLSEIDITYSRTLGQCLPWLFLPHGDYRIRKLAMDDSGLRSSHRARAWGVLQPSFPQLEELTVTCDWGDNLLMFAHEVLRQCSTLRVLRWRNIRRSFFSDRSIAIILPTTLETLDLNFYAPHGVVAPGKSDHSRMGRKVF